MIMTRCRPIYGLLLLKKASNPFPEICNSYSASETKFPQCLDMHLIFLRYFHISRTVCDRTPEIWKICYWIYLVKYVLYLNKILFIMMSQKADTLYEAYFGKTSICLIAKFVLEDCAFVILARVIKHGATYLCIFVSHSCILNRWAKFCAKIFTRFWDIIFVLACCVRTSGHIEKLVFQCRAYLP